MDYGRQEAYFQQNKVSQTPNFDENVDFGPKSIDFPHFGGLLGYHECIFIPLPDRVFKKHLGFRNNRHIPKICINMNS